MKEITETLYAVEENPVCSWCRETIEKGQPISKSYDGEVMHFGCACEADDPDEYGKE